MFTACVVETPGLLIRSLIFPEGGMTEGGVCMIKVVAMLLVDCAIVFCCKDGPCLFDLTIWPWESARIPVTVLVEVDLTRIPALCASDVPFLALKMTSSGLRTSTSPLSRRDLRTETFSRRDFFPDSPSSRRTDAKGGSSALGPPVERSIGLGGFLMSSTTSTSGIPLCSCVCLTLIASFEGSEGVEEGVGLLTKGLNFVDVPETGRGVDLDSSVGGGNEGGRPEMPRDIRSPKDWYEVVIPVVVVCLFPIGVTNLARKLCSWASRAWDLRVGAGGGRTQGMTVSGFCFAFDCASSASLDGPREPCF